MIVSRRGLRFRGVDVPCSIGRGGVTVDKREGDGATPRGRLEIIGCLYRPDRTICPAPWAEPIRPGDLWSDDPEDESYNQLVRAPYAYSHEHMRRADPLYDLVLLTDWNWPNAVPGKGSAIFMHRWRKPGHPTEGCIAVSVPALRWIARLASPGTTIQVL